MMILADCVWDALDHGANESTLDSFVPEEITDDLMARVNDWAWVGKHQLTDVEREDVLGYVREWLDYATSR